MISKALEVFAKSVGMKSEVDCVYGVYGGFFMTVTERKSSRTVEVSCYIGDSDEYTDDYVSINEAVRNVLDKYSITDYAVDENCVSVKSRAELSVFREMIDYIAGMLDSVGIYKSDHCSKCGELFKDASDKRVVTLRNAKESHKHLVCGECALVYAESNENKTDHGTEASEEKLGKGLLFAILAGLLGAAVYAFVCWLLGVNGRMDMFRFAPCLFGALIGALVVYVYRVAAGRYSVKSLVILSVITGVVTVLAHYCGCVLGFIKYLSSEKGIYPSSSFSALPSVMKMQFTDPYNLPFFIVGSIIALCCAYIALIFVYGTYRKKKTVSKKMDVSIQRVK
ncbi:MAG: hypothetical protein IJK33_09600 [Clostridia bacterium]|nr:hypothetical protein [Clostridia bacterium]